MKSILVTGSNGQLGNEIKILGNDYRNIEFFFHDVDTLDLTDYPLLEDFFYKHKPDYVINCAAYTAVDKAEKEKEQAFMINAEVPGKLAELSKKYMTKLIHISTDYVFDGKNYRPYKEDDVPDPISVYGKSKFEGENRILDHNNAVIIRTSWLYSAFGNNFVKTILKLGKEKKELGIVFDQIGSPTYAGDLASAILQIISSSIADEKNYLPGIYHYANEGVCSWYDLAVEIIRVAGLDCKINPVETWEYPLPAKRPLYSVLNKNKIKSTFKLDIPHWKDSLTLFLKAYAHK